MQELIAEANPAMPEADRFARLRSLTHQRINHYFHGRTWASLNELPRVTAAYAYKKRCLSSSVMLCHSPHTARINMF